MIRCRLVNVTRNRAGKPQREARAVSGEPLRIGRGAECEIHLPDPRVSLHHAAVRRGDDGQFYLEAEGNTLNADGRFEQRLRLRPGQVVSIGPYRFEVEAPEETEDLALSVELVSPLPDDRERLASTSQVSLAQTGLSKRRMALALGGLALLLFLVLPVLYAVSPGVRMATAHLPYGLDKSWDPGPLSAGHVGFGNDCRQCHQVPFVQVRDEACTACHTGIGPHIADASLEEAVFGEMRCASCHRDHKGLEGLARGDASQCVDCHGDVKAHAAGSLLADIRDFGRDHPPFRLSLAQADGSVLRLPQGDPATREDSGLIFPHDVHMAPDGVKSPDGQRILDCGSCHVADRAGVRFEPVTMKAHCADCHRLDFEPAVTTRQVPHAHPREVMTTLREFYSAISLGDVPVDVITLEGMLRQPPGRPDPQQRRRAEQWVEEKAMAIGRDLFEARVCQTCHEVSYDAAATEVPWSIAPVTANPHWMPKARFDHRSHGSFSCADCHAAATSTASSDINLPDLDTCRTCHAGQSPATGQLASTCATCHGFHVPGPSSGLAAPSPAKDSP
jgi:pSer/pThr/pTyr-binding forkhead associated (FHA) protein